MQKKLIIFFMFAAMSTALLGCNQDLYSDETETIKEINTSTEITEMSNEDINKITLPDGYEQYSKSGNTIVFAKKENNEYVSSITYIKSNAQTDNVKKIGENDKAEEISTKPVEFVNGEFLIETYGDIEYTVSTTETTAMDGTEMFSKTFTTGNENNSYYIRADYVKTYDIEKDISEFLTNNVSFL